MQPPRLPADSAPQPITPALPAPPAPQSEPPAGAKIPAPVAAEIARLLADPTLPEPVRRFLSAGGELERIVLDDQGQWSHQGEPFINVALSALFSRSLVRTPGGTWVLYIAPFNYPVQVADTPSYVRSARVAGDVVLLSLTDGSEEPLDPSTLRYVESRGLYCRVQAGHAARLLRPAYFALADHMAEAAGRFSLTLGAQRIEVPVVTWETARAGG